MTYYIYNRSSKTVLVSFFDGETQTLELHSLAPDACWGSEEMNLGLTRDSFKYFDRLWKNEASEFRLYTADTILIRTWRPHFNPRSEKKEFYRESDWEVDCDGIAMICTYVNYHFNIEDSDLVPLTIASVQE